LLRKHFITKKIKKKYGEVKDIGKFPFYFLLHKLHNIDECLIVYDGNKIESNPRIFQGNNKMKEYVYKGEGISGNPQRNYALTKITNSNTSLYYLDDDNTLITSKFT